MNPAVKFGLLALLAAVAALYFAIVAWRASGLTLVLLRRGYAERGWDEARLARRIRLVGVMGLGVSVLALAIAVLRLVR